MRLYPNLSLALISSLSAVCSADIPQMGGPMSHLLVSIFDQQVFVTFESPSMSTVELQRSYESFNGAASVLNGTGHNAQFGWLANGFISLPTNSGVFVRQTWASSSLEVYSEFGFEPILGTDGSESVWEWNGTMVHNWYASRIMGPQSTGYEVFVGDSMGNPLDGWTGADIRLDFTFGADMSGRYRVLNPDLQVNLPGPGGLLALFLVLPFGRHRSN